MSLAELTSNTFPRLSGRLTLRRIKTVRASTLKATRKHTRKAIRTTIQWQRSQYYLATATRDLRQAAHRNEDIVLATTFVSLTIVFAFASTAAHIILQSFLTMSYLNDVTGFSVLPLALLFAGVLATLAGWLAAWLSNALSLSIMDGANRKRIKSIRLTFRRALQLAARTATSWLILLTVLGAPIMILGLLSLGWVRLATSGGATTYFDALALTISCGTLWLLYAITTFGLAPQVALFEPSLPLIDTLKRSRSLVLRRGRPFILALYLSIGAFVAGMYGAAALLASVIGSVSDIVFYAAILLAVIATNLMLTVLYRKRRLARTN